MTILGTTEPHSKIVNPPEGSGNIAEAASAYEPGLPEEAGHVSTVPNVDSSLRPTDFENYPGQEKVKKTLKIAVQSCIIRGSSLDHVLLHGPPGLGKTTLAKIIAKELGASFHQTSGPAIDKPSDLVGIIAGLEPGSVLFVDEIHRLAIQIEEILYSAMEDFQLDIIVGTGPSARTVSMPIAPFTLIAATTKASSLSRPLRNRFGIIEKLHYYDKNALAQIIRRNADILNLQAMPGSLERIAERSRGTPRIANRLLKRIRDYCVVHDSKITEDIVQTAFADLKIDPLGLDEMDRFILSCIRDVYNGGPVGIDALAASLGEEKSTIEEIFEPYLVHLGFIARTPKGRVITEKAIRHLS